MTSKKINLFSTPIYYKQFEGESLAKVQSELQVAYDDHIENNLFADPFRDGRMETSNGTFAEDVFEKYRPMTLLNGIGDAVKDYMADYTNSEYDAIINNAWMTRMRQNTYCHVHSHSGYGGAHISGVYYFKTEPDDAYLFFETPNEASAFSPVGKSSPERINPRVGQLLLFPSWLKHGVTTQKHDRDRVSVSFNIGLRFR